MPIQIPLINGGFAIIDEGDACLAEGRPWYAQYRYYRGERLGVAAVRSRKGRDNYVLLHHLILPAPVGMVVDHRDCNPLNNTRANLRVCSGAENARNSRMRSHNQSGVKGIYYDDSRGSAQRPWRAQIVVDGKKIYLGRFSSTEEAGLAYRAAAIKYHGDFARVA